MKILLLTPEDNTVRGIIGGYCKKALEKLGNEVLVFDFFKTPFPKNKLLDYLRPIKRRFFPSSFSPASITKAKPLIDQKINSMLIERVSSDNPDLLLVLLGENIFPQTIQEIKERGVTCVNWVFDTLLFPHRQPLIQKVEGYYDYLFLIDSLDILRRINIKSQNIITMPLACDPEIHKRISPNPDEIKRYGSDVAFVGTVSPERERVLEALADFDLKIWGRWDNQSRLLKRCYQKKDVYKEEAVKVYNSSKVIIDIHWLYPSEKLIFSVTPRVFEVPACDSFLLTNHIPQLNDFYKVGEEIITYKSTEELVSLVKYYLGHAAERQGIAQRAFQRALNEHTYINRMKKMLSCIS